jgi:DNA-binding CsgD family transcriptional regulator/catechol 2,3-dioxygenase-like lactoylglutathione lyase family enzyme
MPRGRPPHPDILTPAEWRVVNAVRHGLTNRQIAGRLRVSADAIKFHVVNALGKLSLTSRRELRHWDGVPRDSIARRRLAMSERLSAIGQISRQVSDLPRAVEWYRDVLGLTHLFTFGDLAFFDCDGVRLFLTSAKERGSVSSGDSVIYFRTNDIHGTHTRLAAKGVAFLGAPHMIHRHDSGVEEWMAFFHDPDGKVLALMSQVSPATAP